MKPVEISRTVTEREHFLIVRNDRLGDAILALPVVTSLKDRFPESRISFLASPYTAPLIECAEGIERVIRADDRHCAAALRDIISSKITAALCLRPTFSNALTLARARIPTRIGTAYRAYSLLFTNRVKLRRRGMSEHETDLNLALLAGLGVTPVPRFPQLNLPDQAWRAAEALLKKIGDSLDKGIIVLHPGSGGSSRDWPPEYYRQLGRLLGDEGYKVIATGSANERQTCSRIVGDNERNLAGMTDIVTLAAVLSQARLVVTGGTGPLHLANALGRPVLGLYPPIRDILPVRWGPFGHPEMTISPNVPLCKKCRPGHISKCWCMEQITPEMVYERAECILNQRVNSGAA